MVTGTEEKKGKSQESKVESAAFKTLLSLLLLLAFGFQLPTARAQQPQTSTAPIFSANAKYVQGVGPGYWPTAGAGLTLNLTPGTAYCGNPPVLVTYAGGTLAMTDGATNYVYLDPAASCAPAKNTTGFAVGEIPLATVVTAGGAITNVTDARGWFAPLPCVMGSTGAVTCAASGTNQNITLTPSGTGVTKIGDTLLTLHHALTDGDVKDLEITTNFDPIAYRLKDPSQHAWNLCVACNAGGDPAVGAVALYYAAPTSGAPDWTKKWSVESDGVERIPNRVLTPRVNNIRYADQFPGANMGEKIAAAIADLPSTGGTVDASGFEWWQTISSDIFAGVTKPGTLLLGSNTYYVSATQNVPSNWNIRGAFNGRLDNGSAPGGTILLWTGAADQPVLKYLSTEFTSTQGVSINCNRVAGTTGILIDGNNTQASHDNRFEDFQIEGCAIDLQVGTSGAAGYQSDGVTIRNFTFANFTVAGLRINSQNALQGSVIERGYFRYPTTNGSAPMIDVGGLFAPWNLAIRNVVFGAGAGYTGCALQLSHDASSGGSTLLLEENEFEVNPGTAICATTEDASGGALVLLGNQFSNAGATISGRRAVVSVGNNWGTADPVLSHANSKLTVIGDVFTPPHNWNVAGGNNTVMTNGHDPAAGQNVPLRVIHQSNEVAEFEAGGADPYVRLANTSGLPSDWRLVFPGTGTGMPAPGDLVFRDGANARNLLHLSKALGAVGIGSAVNPYMSPGDLSVARNSSSGGIFFGTETEAYLDYGLMMGSTFTFTGGPVKATQFGSTVTTGTPPFTVASTTPVASLSLSGGPGTAITGMGKVASSVNVVTYSGTPTFDASLGNTQKITLAGNVTSSVLSNASAGQTINFLICQDATGGRTFTWPASVKGGMTIGSSASKCSAQSFVYDGVNAYALSPGASNM